MASSHGGARVRKTWNNLIAENRPHDCDVRRGQLLAFFNRLDGPIAHANGGNTGIRLHFIHELNDCDEFWVMDGAVTDEHMQLLEAQGFPVNRKYNDLAGKDAIFMRHHKRVPVSGVGIDTTACQRIAVYGVVILAVYLVLQYIVARIHSYADPGF